MNRQHTRFRKLALAVLGVMILGATGVKAAPPQGVVKQAIHWGISADWLDPSTASYVTTANHPLYLLSSRRYVTMEGGKSLKT